MLAKLDAQIGKTMFQPIIIAICQAAGWTQYQFSRTVHTVPPAIALYALHGWFTNFIFGVSFVVRAVIWFRSDSEDESKSDLLSRLFCWILLGYSLFYAVRDPDYQIIAMVLFFIITLFAEYACTIKTIPPREEKFTKMATDSIW